MVLMTSLNQKILSQWKLLNKIIEEKAGVKKQNSEFGTFQSCCTSDI